MNLFFLFLATTAFLIMSTSQSVSAAESAEDFSSKDLPVKSDTLNVNSHMESARLLQQTRVGGYFPVDPTDAGAVDAAKYAVSTVFPSATTSIKITAAKGQIVNGMKYDLDVAVTFNGDESCSMHNFVVLAIRLRNKASPYTLMSNKALTSQECESA
jgi:hypothetical protein